MNKQSLIRVAITALFLLCGARTAPAQPADNFLTIDIPFAFHLNNKQLPAGAYTFKRVPQMPNVLFVENADKSLSVMVLTNQVELPSGPLETSLTFNEYGEKRFLSEVKIAWRGFKYTMIKSRVEHKLAQTIAARVIRTVPKHTPSRLSSDKHPVSQASPLPRWLNAEPLSLPSSLRRA